MRKGIIGYLFVTFLSLSCTNTNNNRQFIAVIESLNSTNKNIETNNKYRYNSFEERLLDPQTKSKAERWKPNVARVKKIIDSALLYINQLKKELALLAGKNMEDFKEIQNVDDHNSVEQLFVKKNKGKELVAIMKRFKSELIDELKPIDIDDNALLRQVLNLERERLRKEFPIVDASISQTDTSTPGKTSYSDYFQKINLVGAMAMLTKIQNDVLTAEQFMITYIIEQTTYHGCGLSSEFFPVVSQNSTIIKSGQHIEITAGIGSFSNAAKPIFTINGKISKSDVDGIVFYKIRVKKTPGTYTIPFKVEFTKADGASVTMSKNIEYRVVQ